MPQVLLADEEQRMEYYNSYVDTYLMRDVSETGGITDVVRFRKFLNACAALVGEQVNYKNSGRDCGNFTAHGKGWVSILQGRGDSLPVAALCK